MAKSKKQSKAGKSKTAPARATRLGKRRRAGRRRANHSQKVMPRRDPIAAPSNVLEITPADSRGDDHEAVQSTELTIASDDGGEPFPGSAEENAPGPLFMVVGVGASAGGLEAFSQLLRALPEGMALAIIYVQHLAPHYESTLASLLSATTKMPVSQVVDRTPIKPGHVYVIPPNAFLTIAHGLLRLSPRPEGRSQHAPVDHFFRSLAEYAQQRAVGVILSGTDSDGAAGLREIKAVGGITFAQDPASAKFDGMPRAAISTGAVDNILPADGIASELGRLAHHPLIRHVRAKTREAQVEISEAHWQKIYSLLRSASGVDFTHYKQPTLQRRLQRRMLLNKSGNIEHYLRYLQQNPDEINELYHDILIHVTRFFREPDSYEFLSSRIFPQIVGDRRSGDQAVRVWVPGCATGEEAYSVTMCLLEFLGDEATATPVQVFATDVSEAAVEQARTGIYPESISEDVSPERLRRFFNKVDGSYRISKTVRDAVIFARQDLTRDPPFSKLDLIVCRNVLIYLGPVLQKKLMNVFHYALRPTGFLVLGASESIGSHSDLFTLADKKFKAYTKKLTGIRTSMEFRAGGYGLEANEASATPAADPRTGPTILNEANRIILNRYAPPGVLVDEDLQIIQFRGQTGPFLEPAPGEASLNLLKMAREGLLYGLRLAITDARKTGSPTRRENLRVKYNGHIIDVNIEVMPIVVANDHRHFLVVFDDVSPGAPTRQQSQPEAHAKSGKPGNSKQKSSARPSRDHSEAGERVRRLEQELAASREYLQSIIQDLEAANEELQSANEEILSSNEELQSTNEELDTAKEELQSTNEELNTVNEELQGRNEELSRVNSDLMNLLSSVQIAVVMVTSDLRIRRFTPMAEKLLNLIPTDIGRPISNIKPNIDLPDLEKLIMEVIDSVNSLEREVKDRQGGAYLLRIRPYKSVENRIDGAVLAIFDLEMAGEHHLMQSDPQAILAALLSIAFEPVVVLDGTLHVRYASESFLRTFKMDSGSTAGQSIYGIAGGQWDLPPLHELLEHRLPREHNVYNFQIEATFRDIGARRLSINARRLEHDGQNDLVVLAINLIE